MACRGPSRSVARGSVASAGAWCRRLPLLLLAAPVLVAGRAYDCESRRGGAFITFSVRRGSLGYEPGANVVEGLVPSAVAASTTPALRGAAGAAVGKRTDGVQDVFQVTQWIADDRFIKTAIGLAKATSLLLSRESKKIPVFNKLKHGTDCDSQWSWHVDPHDVGGWADVTTEVCDATPEYIERDPQAWLSSPGRWCPWGFMEVLRVEDRRPESSFPKVVIEKKSSFRTIDYLAINLQAAPQGIAAAGAVAEAAAEPPAPPVPEVVAVAVPSDTQP